ncbi:hypothetical protein JM49_14740 [Pseudomonas chlororaphis subsp. aurantiaca]|nr:hypothetical protein JM49_14740 [Pseudomonas chlororaphis subsp. aurantiaca]
MTATITAGAIMTVMSVVMTRMIRATVIIAATIAETTMGAIAAIVTTITNNDDESRGRFRSP